MTEFYVSAAGKDTNPGTKELPFLTPDRASEAVRSAEDTEISVSFFPGEYRTKGISLDLAGKKLTLRAPAGGVSLNGGITLPASAFTSLSEEEKDRLHGEAKEKVVKADLSALGITKEELGEICAIGSYQTAARYSDGKVGPIWCELFADGERMELARYPDTGYIRTDRVVKEGCGLHSAKGTSRTAAEWQALRDPESDSFTLGDETNERVRTWKTMRDVWMFGYPRFGWADASTPIRNYDPETGTVEAAYVSMYGMIDRFPYYFFNVFEELDVPGEWYLDRETETLYLYPKKEIAETTLCLSLMTGEILNAGHADGMTLDGIAFEGTRGTGVSLSGNGITVKACVFRNIGGDALHISGDRNTVRDCEILHIGRAGIRAGGGDRKTLTPSETVITNNHIHHIAEIYRTYQPGIQISGCGVTVSHNEIHHSSHMAIGFSGNEHRMEYNEIYEVCLVADDSSAIYTGRDYTTCGNHIRYNFFHDMKSDADSHIGIFGVYCDDNTGETEIYGNVFLRCQSALLLHGGHDITFKNNLIVGACPKSQFSMRFHRYGYWNDLLPGGTHGARLAEVPWQGEIWSAHYPHIAEYLTWDPETVQCYPHYCRVSENAVVSHKPIDINFDCHKEEYKNHVENNAEFDAPDCVKVSVSGALSVDFDALCALVPGLQPIPLDEIGRK